jgi:hypothetical protein
MDHWKRKPAQRLRAWELLKKRPGYDAVLIQDGRWQRQLVRAVSNTDQAAHLVVRGRHARAQAKQSDRRWQHARQFRSGHPARPVVVVTSP